MSEATNDPIDLLTRYWVRPTGRRTTPVDRPWLDGPVGRDVRADHVMWIFDFVFLRLHDKLRRKTVAAG